MMESNLKERNAMEKARRAAMTTKVEMADRKVAEERRTAADRSTKTAHLKDVPPYCYRLPGMSAEAGAVEAIKALNISHPCDALALLWKLRRVVCDGQTEGRAPKCAVRPPKNQPRPTVQAAGLFNRGVAPEKELHHEIYRPQIGER